VVGSVGAAATGKARQGAAGLAGRPRKADGGPTRCPRARARARMCASSKARRRRAGSQPRWHAHTAESTCCATVGASRGGGGMSPCTNGQPPASPLALALGFTGMEMLTGSRPRAGTLISGGMAAGCIESSTGGAVGGTACAGPEHSLIMCVASWGQCDGLHPAARIAVGRWRGPN
jgi:hypothetical protein